MKRQLEQSEVDGLQALELGGIYFDSEPKRVYPNDSLAAQVVGFVGIDGSGIEGLEYTYDDELAGVAGYLIEETGREGRRIPDTPSHRSRPFPAPTC